MAASTVTYVDKVQSRAIVADATEQFRFSDANEIKTVVNANATLQDTNTTNIATNTTGIATNVTNIATNVTDIATNASGIATNVTNIATNVTNISTAQTTANNALPKAGGAMTGAITGDQSIRAYRPVGGGVEGGATNLQDLVANSFHLVDPTSGATTITVTDAANSAFAVGTEFEFFAINELNTMTFATSGSQIILSKDANLSIAGAASAVVLKKYANNNWALIGDLA